MDIDDNRMAISAICPPAEMLMKVCHGDLGDPYAMIIAMHIKTCKECRVKTLGYCGFLEGADADPGDSEPRPAGSPAGAGPATIATSNDWRRTTYNCGDPEWQPRCHLVATRPLTLASVGPAAPHPMADYYAWVQQIDWSGEFRPQDCPIGAADPGDLARLLRVASGPADGRITVILPAEAAWLAESLMSDATAGWRIFLADTAPQNRRRRPLMEYSDGPSGATIYQVEATAEEAARMSRWLLDKQGIPAGRLAGTAFAALGRILGRGDSESFIPPDDPLMILIPRDDPPVDDGDLLAMFARGHRDLVSTP